MARVIAAINMTLDGFCDHTAMIADVIIQNVGSRHNDILSRRHARS